MEERRSSSKQGALPMSLSSTSDADSHHHPQLVSSFEDPDSHLSRGIPDSTTPPEPESPQLLAHRASFQSSKRSEEEISLYEPPHLSIASTAETTSLPTGRLASSTSSAQSASEQASLAEEPVFIKPAAPRSAADTLHQLYTGDRTSAIASPSHLTHAMSREPVAGQIHARDDISASGSEFSESDTSSLLDIHRDSGSSAAAHHAAQMRWRYSSLQFRSSTEAAMRCSKIIKNKPRMRKRRKKLTAEDQFKTTDCYDDSKREQDRVTLSHS
jgi:hypothetical protein